MSSCKKVLYKTFGCRTNQFDTQIMRAGLQEYESTQDLAEADVVVINSCTVTNAADASVRNFINKVRKKSSARIIFGGCGAFSQGEKLYTDARVDAVFGHSTKHNLKSFINAEKGFDLGNLQSVDDTLVTDFEGKTRAFVKIQEGCDFECSYCIIPSVRGGARSHDPDLIAKQVQLLADRGYKEFILTGTNVGSFCNDSGHSLPKLLRRLGDIRGVKRLRLGSLEPSQIDEAFIELLKEPWMAKHLHIALQHTDDAMLEIMRRRNRFVSDLALFERLADMDIALGTDFIVGHPGEDEKRFENAYNRLHSLPLTHIHCFSYSPKEGTASAKMKDTVAGNVAKERNAKISRLIAQKNYAFRQARQNNLQILLEKGGKTGYKGYDQYFNPITVYSKRDLSNHFIEVDHVKTEKNGNFKTL